MSDIPTDQTNAPGGQPQPARSPGEKASEQIQATLDQARDTSAEQVDTVTDSLRAARDRLSGDNDAMAGVVGSAADHLESFAGSLRSKDLGEVLSQVEQFGRRQPAAFLGASVAIGFALARFAKATKPEKRRAAVSNETSAASTDWRADPLDPFKANHPAGGI